MQKSQFAIAAVFAGSLLPVQIALNARVASTTGALLLAVLVSNLVGISTLLMFMVLLRQPFPTWSILRQVPWWGYLGGVAGICYVTSSIYLVATLGAALTIGLVIAGQTFSSLVIDHFGWLNMPERPLTPSRWAAGGCAAIAIYFLLK